MRRLASVRAANDISSKEPIRSVVQVAKRGNKTVPNVSFETFEDAPGAVTDGNQPAPNSSAELFEPIKTVAQAAKNSNQNDDSSTPIGVKQETSFSGFLCLRRLNNLLF